MQSRWAPALMMELTGKVRARGRRSQEWMGTHYGRKRLAAGLGTGLS